MNISTLYLNYFEKSAEQNKSRNVLMANAMVLIIQNYFLTMAPSFVLTLSCRKRLNCDFFIDLLGELFGMIEAPVLQLVVIEENLMKYVPGHRFYNLIVVDSFEAFKEIDVTFYTKHYNYNEYYHIVLQAPPEFLLAETQLMLAYCWKHQIINCNVQLQEDAHTVQIYTYFPYTAQQCESVAPVLINQYNGSSWSLQDHLFPQKLQNFYGCPLRVATWHAPPFVHLVTDENGTSIMTAGFERKLVETLANELNFSIEIKVPPNDEQRGRLINDTWNGALGMLHARTVDMSLGCFREAPDRSANATSVISYYMATMSVCFEVANYDLTSFQILRFPFKVSAWLFIFVLLTIVILVSDCLNRFLLSTKVCLYLDILRIFFGLPATNVFVSNYARLLSAGWLLFTILLRTCYSALLFHLIRAHVSNRMPQTLEDLVAGNYTVVMNRGTYEGLTDVPYIRDLPQKMLTISSETIAFEYIEDMTQKNLVAAGPIEFMLYYGLSNRKAGRFSLLSQNILNMQNTMYLTKHSFLADKLRYQIMWIRAAGLVQAWAGWELQIDYFKSVSEVTGKQFGLGELYMMFVVLLCGLGIAFIVFVLEVLSLYFRLLMRLFL